MRIIGIDPGSRNTGVGIVDQVGNRLIHVYSTTIVTTQKEKLESRLQVIFEEMSGLIEQYHPQTAAIERVFHSVNPRSSLILGHARGVALLALNLGNLEITEYAPNEVKSAVVGVGRAEKSQVGAMVRVLLNLDRRADLKEDEADALAVAICHANTMNFSRPEFGKKGSF